MTGWFNQLCDHSHPIYFYSYTHHHTIEHKKYIFLFILCLWMCSAQRPTWIIYDKYIDFTFDVVVDSLSNEVPINWSMISTCASKKDETKNRNWWKNRHKNIFIIECVICISLFILSINNEIKAVFNIFPYFKRQIENIWYEPLVCVWIITCRLFYLLPYIHWIIKKNLAYHQDHYTQTHALVYTIFFLLSVMLWLKFCK